MKLVIAATGASGTIYLQRLLEQIDCAAHEIHLVLSASCQTSRQTGTGRLQDSERDRAARRQRSQCSVCERLGPLRRDGDRSLLDGNTRADRFRFQRQRAIARRRCFFEGTPEINSRPARDALEFDSRAQRRDAARSGRDCAAGDSIFLQPPKIDCRSCRHGGLADSRSNRLAKPRAYRWADQNPRGCARKKL